ncbi:uncharacterized protein LOC142168124 [Nicotiana tabacum]|uniref:Uncharacterized protein LOC142168124 n=1 Tax=Nicotiana tabacum TaxID=4097 RepID=A0AC58SIU7_TOBAC
MQILLSEFNIVYVMQKAIKGQELVDHLVKNSVDKDYKTLTTYFLDEKVIFVGEDISESCPGWRMFFDGAANFKGVGIGAVLIAKSGPHYPISAKIRSPCTNNMAEYEGEWTTKNVKIVPYLHCVKELCKKFTKIVFKHVPRIQNTFADAFAMLSSMIQHPNKNYIDPIEIKIQDQHAYYFLVDEEPVSRPKIPP